MSRVAAVLLLAAAALALGACGGGDSSDSTEATQTTQTIPKAEFVKQAEQLCGDYVKDRNAASQDLQKALGKNYDGPAAVPPAAMKAVSDEIVALNDTTRSVLLSITSLPEPEGATQEFARLKRAGQAALDDLDEADAAAKAGDGPALQSAFQQVDKDLNGAKAEAEELGVDACG